LIDVAIDGMQRNCEQKNQTLTVEKWPHSIIVIGDAARLVQVVSNLLDNASRYSAPGTTIYLTTRVQGNRAEVSVQDSGCGIPQENLARIFDLFFQQGQVEQRPRGGLGVGLYLVQQIITAHQGEVTVHCDGPQKGSTFSFWLPVAGSATHGQLPDR
jgi:signal transduction histidine kinase